MLVRYQGLTPSACIEPSPRNQVKIVIQDVARSASTLLHAAQLCLICFRITHGFTLPKPARQRT